MKRMTFFCAILLPFFAFSQSRSAIDLIGGLDYSYRTVQTDSEDPSVLALLENREGEVAKISFRTGFNYNLQLGERFFLRTGVRLATAGYKSEKITDIRWPSEHDGMGGYQPDPNLPHEIQYVFDYWFVEVPLAARYEFGIGKVTPFIELGAAPNIYIATRSGTVTDINNEVAFQESNAWNVNAVQFALMGSLGCNFQLSESWSVVAQPVFRYHLTPMADASIVEHLYSAGLEMGLRKKL